MNIIEEIHQYLTVTKRNCCDTHSGEPEYLTVHSPLMGIETQNHWVMQLMWAHHDGEILLHECRSKSLEEAGKTMLAYLKAEDEPEKRECPECGSTEEHSHQL